MPQTLYSIAVGLGLADSTFYTSKSGPCMKIEYGSPDKVYRYHICNLFKDWTWYEFPSEYVKKSGDKCGLPHSYYFQTFKHPVWFPLENSFVKVKKPCGTNMKSYAPGTITEDLCEIGLRYWIFDDGSLNKQKNYYTLHAERFTFEKKEAMCAELNNKFHLHSYPMHQGGGASMIYCPTKDTDTLRQIVLKKPLIMPRKVYGGPDPSVDQKVVYSSLMNKMKLPNRGYESFMKKLKGLRSLNSGFFGI